MSVRLSLAEQIAQLQEAAPVGIYHTYLNPTRPDARIDFDPEDTLAGAEPAEDLPETTATAREHYVDVGWGEQDIYRPFRLGTDSFSSVRPRFAGCRASQIPNMLE